MKEVFLDDETCDRCGDTCCGCYHEEACAERGECPDCDQPLGECACECPTCGETCSACECSTCSNAKEAAQ